MIFIAGVILALGGFIRSNGFLSYGYILYFVFVSTKGDTALVYIQKAVMLVILLILSFSPFIITELNNRQILGNDKIYFE